MANVREVMTSPPVTVAPDTPIGEVAALMRDHDIGAVIVSGGTHLEGIVTDRDLAVRGIAEDLDPRDPVSAVRSDVTVSVAPDDDVESVATVMRRYAVRRLPVVEAGEPVGMIALGDLAADRDADSALADISTATPNT